MVANVTALEETTGSVAAVVTTAAELPGVVLTTGALLATLTTAELLAIAAVDLLLTKVESVVATAGTEVEWTATEVEAAEVGV